MSGMFAKLFQPPRVVIEGVITLQPGWFNGYDWVEDDDTFPVPPSKDIKASTLIITMYKPSGATHKREVISNPKLPHVYEYVFDTGTVDRKASYSFEAVLYMKRGEDYEIRRGDWSTPSGQFESTLKLPRNRMDMYMLHNPPKQPS
mmetsp:Transcript_13692/g.36477  ORF Transcript_13692/g.36477 Transcript_13692/m.36477 type:complete len:146 (-) Transcript_13692:276-713(-)